MEHPKGFYMLSSATMLESFSYFVFAVILVLYMTDVLHFTDSFSTYFFGIAYGMTYLFQIVGGYLSDRYFFCHYIQYQVLTCYPNHRNEDEGHIFYHLDTFYMNRTFQES